MPTSVAILDQDAELVAVLTSELERRKFQVLSARSAQEGLQLLQARSVDVVLAELRLAGAGGLRFLKSLQEHSAQTRVVLMTAKASAEDYKRALKSGAVELLTKPFSVDALVNAIQTAADCDTGFRGNLHGIALLDVLQLMHFGRRTVTVLIGDNGAIHMRDGEVIHAEHADRVGRFALESVLTVDSGSVRTTSLQAKAQTIFDTFSALMLETLCAVDEQQAGRSPSVPSASSSSASATPAWTDPAESRTDPRDILAASASGRLHPEFGLGSTREGPMAYPLVSDGRPARVRARRVGLGVLLVLLVGIGLGLGSWVLRSGHDGPSGPAEPPARIRVVADGIRMVDQESASAEEDEEAPEDVGSVASDDEAVHIEQTQRVEETPRSRAPARRSRRRATRAGRSPRGRSIGARRSGTGSPALPAPEDRGPPVEAPSERSARADDDSTMPVPRPARRRVEFEIVDDLPTVDTVD